MSEIRLKTDYVRDSSKMLKTTNQNLLTIEKGITSVRSSLDSQIVSRASIGSRLQAARLDVDSVQTKIRELEFFIHQSTTRYVTTENRLCHKAEDVVDETGLDFNALRNTAIGFGAGILNSSKLLRLKNGLQFKLFKQGRETYIRILGDKIKNLKDFQRYYDLLKAGLGGTAKWNRPFVEKLVNEGVPLYQKQKKGKGTFYQSNSNKLINSQFADFDTYINQLNTKKYKIAGKTLVEEMKFWEAFKGWKGATDVTKLGKGAGILGLGIDVVSNFKDNFINPAGKLEVTWGNTKEFVVDTGVDVGIGTAAMATGAAAGSFFLPPVGTVVGATVGSIIYAGANWKYGDPPMSFIDRRKEEFNKAADWAIEKGKGLAESAGKLASGIGKKLGEVFW